MKDIYLENFERKIKKKISPPVLIRVREFPLREGGALRFFAVGQFAVKKEKKS